MAAVTSARLSLSHLYYTSLQQVHFRLTVIPMNVCKIAE